MLSLEDSQWVSYKSPMHHEHIFSPLLSSSSSPPPTSSDQEVLGLVTMKEENRMMQDTNKKREEDYTLDGSVDRHGRPAIRGLSGGWKARFILLGKLPSSPGHHPINLALAPV